MTISHVADHQEISRHEQANMKASDIDFYDFGCSDGQSMGIARSWFSGERGVGIDINPQKVAAARAAGHEAIEADITKLEDLQKSSRFVIASHFLEHLPDLRLIARCLQSACDTARDFVFIRQPWFDSDGYLLSLGLKFYWSDWQDHLCHMTTLDFVKVISRLHGVKRFAVYGSTPVLSSLDSTIHSIHSPQDQHHWVAGHHPSKPDVQFAEGAFREVRAILLPEGSMDTLERLESCFEWSQRIFDSSSIDDYHQRLPSLPYEWRPDDPLLVRGTVSGIRRIESGLLIKACGEDPQIIIPAHRYGSEVSVEIDLTVPCDTEVHLYYMLSSSTGWGSCPPVRAIVQKGRNTRVLSVDSSSLKGNLRIDPGRHQGEYIIHRISIV